MAAARSSSCNTLPTREWFIGGEEHRSFSQVAMVDHMKQNVRGIWTVGQITDF